ncbi:DivIVA domain-containing protein [Enterococcus gilvus]|uniref:DivIVA domain-containing protein n=1 Tax=Enterococcus gilvus TaxID=160453 RepID=UPI00290C3513|nr:DivIVA domain-containing protein [Enterococcus gilvus]MDU5512076.1 DivIVA domain-containing protein [Enterococcus gilvus]
MHFKPRDIRGMTFRRQLFGYRVGDVKDFMKHIVEDYESYQVSESDAIVYQDKIAELKETIENQKWSAQQLSIKNMQLKSENERFRSIESEVYELDKMKELAQKTADTVQMEAQLLLEQAKRERDAILQEAETTKMNHLLNLQIDIDELVHEQEHLNVLIANKKKSLFELDLQYQDVLAEKERFSREAQLLKSEFMTLRNRLLQKYEEELNEFIEENELLSQPLSEDSGNKVTNLTSKLIG